MLRTTILLALCSFAKAAYEGDFCTENGVVGVCTNVKKCNSALESIKNRNRKQPQLCSFEGDDPVVCCFDNVPPSPVATTQKPSSTTEIESPPEDYEPPPEDYVVLKPSATTCGPLDANLTSPRTGQKAWDKCIEYQEKLVYPCEATVSLSYNTQVERKYKCHINADELIVGGEDAKRNEFTHMALLGFGQPPNIKWECGGSLISEKFILTAAHCVVTSDKGNITYASIGVLTRSEVDPTNTYKIKEKYRHPQYRRGVYNDIALLELEKEVVLGEYRVPACLHVGDIIKDDRAMATGWGLLEYEGAVSDTLQKVTVLKFRTSVCKKLFPKNTQVSHNYDADTQLCYGDKNKPRDTCQGDSGGPLQVKHKKINCMYLIMGVTSGGRGCAWRGRPGLYSRVSHYISWIESVVWP